MNPAITAAITASATDHAAIRCAAALETIAKGRQAYLKGKLTTVPYLDEGRAQLARLQRFDAGEWAIQTRVVELVAMFLRDEGVTSDEAADALTGEAMALYCQVGNAAVDAAIRTPRPHPLPRPPPPSSRMNRPRRIDFRRAPESPGIRNG